MRRFALLVAGLALLAGVAAAVSGGGTQAETRWVITDLGTLGGKTSAAVAILPGFENSEAVAINERGQVIGYSYTLGGGRRAFLWQRGKMTDLGALSGKRYSEAWAINEGGQIIGESYARFSGGIGRVSRAFVWEDGQMRDLGDFDPNAMSDRGQVVGGANTKSGHDHAALWEKGRVIDLGTLPGGMGSQAVAINEHGQIVGWSETKSRHDRAVL